MRIATGDRCSATGGRRSSLVARRCRTPIMFTYHTYLPYLTILTLPYLTGAISYFSSQVGPLKKQHSEPPRLADASEAPRLRDSDLPDDGRRTADGGLRRATGDSPARTTLGRGRRIGHRRSALGGRQSAMVVRYVARCSSLLARLLGCSLLVHRRSFVCSRSLDTRKRSADSAPTPFHLLDQE